MITKRHTTSIMVNGEELQFETQDSINLRINNTIYNPEKVSVTQSEYSFSFNVPQTPKNNRIFGFANVPSVRGKFLRKFNAYVYADGTEIFQGVLRISSIEDGKYKCNLISVKNSSVDDIFGESVMSDIRWEVPYLGGSTINTMNSEDDPDYFFPLVAYGVFQKKPYRSITGDTDTINYYTGTNVLDSYTKFYGETFIPSPKLIEVVKRMITQKGYTYSGDVFTDDLINKIYLSSYISSEQDPAYNIGGSRGNQKVTFSYKIDSNTNAISTLERVDRDMTYNLDSQAYWSNRSTSIIDGLSAQHGIIRSLWNKDKATVLTHTNDEMWEDGFIVIPHDGYYKITANLNIKLDSTPTTLQDSYQTIEYGSSGKGLETRYPHINYSRYSNFPQVLYEMHLVKNNSTDLEFICPLNIAAKNDPSVDKTIYSDYVWTDYPHETGMMYNFSGSGNLTELYYQKQGKTRSYEYGVNPDFIMGVSTMTEGWAIQRQGRSIMDSTDYHYNNYRCNGYTRYYTTPDAYVYKTEDNTDYNRFGQNSDIPSCTYTRQSLKQAKGSGYAMVWLEKNDLITLKSLSKKYTSYSDKYNEDTAKYQEMGARLSGDVTIQAMSPKKSDLNKSFLSKSSFDQNLNLGNFLSDEETQLDFFNNFLTTFNLNCTVENGNINITKNVGNTATNEAVDIDNRINIDEAESEVIDFPTSIQVKWTVSDDESGFYHSVSDEHINDDDWKDWADKGYEEIKLIENDFSTNAISKTSKFSYNWYMDFTLTDYFTANGATHVTNGNVTLTMPIIAKDENFIDGADYEEMMKSDGRSLKQRMWFKSPATSYYVPNRNGAEYNILGNVSSAKEYINICLPTPNYEGYDVLQYRDLNYCILKKYFNINQDVDSNYVTVQVYLTPTEYIRIKNGSLVRFDNDRYRVCKITGYDPTGGNKTKLQLMKL